MSDLAHIAVERRSAVALARLAGEVDLSNAQTVGTRLLAAAEPGCRALIVDLSETAYLDSSWFPAVENVALSLAREGRALRLVCPPGAPTRRLLEIAGIDRILPVDPSVEAAMDAAGGG